MYDFVAQSLASFTSPAIILEAQSLRYIERNPGAEELVEKLGADPADQTARGWLLTLGITSDMLAAVSRPGPDTFSHRLPGQQGAVLHMTRLDSPQDKRRPPLLLLTLHVGEPHEAWEIHNRLVMTVQVNEACEVTLRSLEASIDQLGEVVRAQRELVQGYNSRMAAFMAASEAGEFPSFPQANVHTEP